MLYSNNYIKKLKLNKLVFTVMVYFFAINSIVPFVMISVSQYIYMIAIILIWLLIMVRDKDILFYYLLFLLPFSFYVFIKICEYYLKDSNGIPIFIYGQLITLTPLLLMYFLLSNNQRPLIKVLIIIMVSAYVLTAITTIIGLETNPMAARFLANADVTDDSTEYLYSLNIGGFDMIYSLAVLFPMIICLYKQKIISKAIFWTIAIIMFYCIYRSQYATALMLFSASLILIFAIKKFELKHVIILIFVSLIFLYVFRPLLVEFFNYLSKNTESLTLSERFGFISDSIEGVENTSDAGNRINIYQKQFEFFIKYPISGSWLFSPNLYAGHSLIFDTLGTYGLIGIFTLYLFFKQIFIKFYLPFRKKEYFGYLVWSYILYIGLSIVNPTGFFVVLGFIIPGIAYLIQDGEYKVDKKGVPYLEDNVDL